MAIALRCIVDGMEDVDHDALELGIHLFEGPREALGVLGHLQARCCDTARIGSLARNERYSGILEVFRGVHGGGHVGTFGHQLAAVLDQGLNII